MRWSVLWSDIWARSAGFYRKVRRILQGSLSAWYHLGTTDRISSASLMVVVRNEMTGRALRLTTVERARLVSLVEQDKHHGTTQWRHPVGRLLQPQLDLIHAALRSARYDRRLARNAVRLGPGQWCKHDSAPGHVWSILEVERRTCTIMKWHRWDGGLMPSPVIQCEPVDKLCRIEVVDRRTGDTVGAAAAHCPTLSAMMDGDCRLRMTARVAAYMWQLGVDGHGPPAAYSSRPWPTWREWSGSRWLMRVWAYGAPLVLNGHLRHSDTGGHRLRQHTPGPPGVTQ